MNCVDPLAFAQSLCYKFIRTGTFISKCWHMLYFNINMLWTGCLYSHALCFCQFLAIFSYISISIGSEEELNTVSFVSAEQLLSVQESTTRRKYLMSWNEWHCIVSRQKSGIYNIKFLKIFIIVLISKLIYVNDRVLVYWQKMEDHPQKNNDK